MAFTSESPPIEHAERIVALERKLEAERPHLATRADIADLKAWLM